MKVFSLTYDLNKPGQNYEDLIKEIQKSPGWCKVTLSNWLIATNESAQQLSGRIGQRLDQSDRWLVIRVTNEYAGWLAQDKWDWLRESLAVQYSY